MIKERPILMSAPMVRAILEGRKNQTRRTRSLNKFCANVPVGFAIDYFVEEQTNEWLAISDKEDGEFPFSFSPWIKCPYGNLGDRLWVRESFKKWCIDGTDTVEDGWWTVRYRADNTIQKHCATWDCCATDDSPTEVGCEKEPDIWTPSIHMPRWASRILLEITGIRVERLQDISWDDCLSEGILQKQEHDYTVYFDYLKNDYLASNPKESYQSLINKINGPKTWDENPWVWVVEFMVIEVKGDRMKICSECANWSMFDGICWCPVSPRNLQEVDGDTPACEALEPEDEDENEDDY